MRNRRSWSGLLAMLLTVTVAACGPGPQADEAEDEGSAADAPAPSMATVASGTTLSLTLDQKLSTRDNAAGDAFTATVSQPVTDGSRVLIPDGSTVRGKVTAVQKASDDRPAVLKVDFESVEIRGESQPLVATLTSAEVESEKEMKGEAKKIGGGAAAGAIVGGILSGDAKGALVGAAVGSAAGTAITLATRDEHGVLPAGTPMEIRLDRDLRVKL